MSDAGQTNCPSCGKPLNAGAKFCGSCGAAVGAADAATETAGPTVGGGAPPPRGPLTGPSWDGPGPGRGFFGSLFDFSFTARVGTTVVKVIFGLLVLSVGLEYVGWVVLGFHSSSALGVIFLLIVGPLVSIIILSLWRLLLEVIISIFKIEENTTAIRAHADAFAASRGDDRPMP